MGVALLASVVAIVLLLSSGSKLLSVADFRQAVDEFSLLTKAPSSLRGLVVLTIPALEGTTGVLLLLPAGLHLGAIVALVLASGFALVVGLDKRPTIAHCGCWGIGSAEVPTNLYLGRSLLLLGLAAGLLTATIIDPTTHFDASTRIATAGLALPFALLLLEIPQIGHVIAIQRLVKVRP